MKIKPLGIHLRILVAVFLLIGSTTLALGVVGITISSQFMHQRFEERMAFLARYLAMNCEVGVLINDQQGLRKLADNLLREKDVARVVIRDNRNHPLVDLSHLANPPLSVLTAPVIFKRTKDENILFDDLTGTGRVNPLSSNRPLSEEKIGSVDLHFSTHGIELLVVLIAKKFLWVSFFLALLAAFVFYFLSRPVGVELKKLTVTAQQIGRGDFTLRVTPGRLPETKALAVSFNAMLDSLNESQKSLDRVHRKMVKHKVLADMGKFSLLIAHEFKNPLAIIKSSMDILKRDIDLSSDQTMVDYIEDEIVRLNRLIEDFLQFSKPVAPVFREVDLNQMLADVGKRFEMIYSEEKIHFTSNIPSTPAIAVADRDLLIRALGNIIRNGCDAVNPHGKLELTATMEAHTHFWKAEIADTGTGIDPDVKQKIFEPFFTTRAKGTGLGLAFAAQVIKSHRGFIMAENRRDGGALFTVEIPLELIDQPLENRGHRITEGDGLIS